MRRLPTLILAACTFSALGACGYKGPLVRATPARQAPAAAKPAAPSTAATPAAPASATLPAAPASSPANTGTH